MCAGTQCPTSLTWTLLSSPLMYTSVYSTLFCLDESPGCAAILFSLSWSLFLDFLLGLLTLAYRGGFSPSDAFRLKDLRWQRESSSLNTCGSILFKLAQPAQFEFIEHVRRLLGKVWQFWSTTVENVQPTPQTYVHMHRNISHETSCVKCDS